LRVRAYSRRLSKRFATGLIAGIRVASMRAVYGFNVASG
jgi:hypothetical protein